MRTRSGLVNWLLIALLGGIQLSAFSLIYIKDCHRQLLARYHELKQQQALYQQQHDQLLLEQETFSSAARIHQCAVDRLHMVYPSSQNLIFVLA